MFASTDRRRRRAGAAAVTHGERWALSRGLRRAAAGAACVAAITLPLAGAAAAQAASATIPVYTR